ncbi:MAG: dihydroxyacetone kinase subunit DhaK [Firmicutes bacterium]|nr:dihydroxyacetone kinase subunit DhaK [Bacillota bacterium]
MRNIGKKPDGGVEMKKFVNDPNNVVKEELEGFTKAYSHITALTDDYLVVRKQPKEEGKVGIVIGHGVGHEPSICGWVGKGFFDVDAAGEIFACAPADKILSGIRAADRGAGVLQIIANHAGDVLNGNLAYEMAIAEGIKVEKVLLYDDIVTAPKGQEENRRGVAGMFFAMKIAGAAAERGWSLEECARVTRKANANTRTLGVALSPPTHPVTGKVMFDLPDDEMEIGMGVHGEAGTYKGEMLSADETMELMAKQVIEDKPFTPGEEVLVLLNGSGATTLMELHILYRKLDQILAETGIKVYDVLLGEFITTQEMKGFSLSLCSVDDEIKSLWDDPCETAYFTKA